MTRATLMELKRFVPRPPVLIGWLVLIGILGWSYGECMVHLARVWWGQPDYGHGFFVPVFALVLLWLRREMVDPLPAKGSWWGLVFLGMWAALQWGAAYLFFAVMNPLSLIPCFAGIALFVGGWRALHWAWPSIVFLVFMIPLPGFLSELLSTPLQRIGTITSVYAIQTLGIPAIAQGNVIVLTEGQLGVVEACSGIRMLMLFFAVCIGAAFVLRCTLWEKAVIVVSAVPIAIFANVFRITLTAFLHELVSTELADFVFHELAGLLMMPIAMLLLWGEMVLLSKLLLEPVPKSSISITLVEHLRENKGSDA